MVTSSALQAWWRGAEEDCFIVGFSAAPWERRRVTASSCWEPAAPARAERQPGFGGLKAS